MKRWFSATELAEMKLPGLPHTDRGVHAKAKREGWATAKVNGKPGSRRRRKRGGGLEYHINVLPFATQRAIAANEMADAAFLRRWRISLFGLSIRIEVSR
jgi:hypothetical protein